MHSSRLPPIAIIGMAGIFPQAHNIQEYWHNILHKIDCITDVPISHWNIDDYYDPDPTTPDKTHCKRGGFIPTIDFNPMEFGLPPNILEVTDVSQLLALVVAKQAMEDAGYDEQRSFARERTGVILGVGGGQKLMTPLVSRLQYPIWEQVLKRSGVSDEDTQRIIEKIKRAYIPWEENSFPGMLGNVIAGRITNRLNLGGTNCVVDAACASSLAALKMAISELAEGRCDMMISGGVDMDNSIFMYMCFSKTPAISSQMIPRPFDKDADGMMVGEGLGMLVLKRLDDAERDHDHIYAVIKSIGTSSDGKNKSIYAPHPAGQSRALRSAYQSAGIDPCTVGLIEAHGTGTVAGDLAEFTSLRDVFSENNSCKQGIALGSIKSQIGHTKAAAGAASLIKAALSLHHKVLPPTLNITEPHPKFALEESPFYLNTETRPWIRSEDAPPRRCGISSFGFGGTNFHVVLEEYTSDHQEAYRVHPTAQPIVLAAETPAMLLARCETLAADLAGNDAAQHYAELTGPTSHLPTAHARLGFVAGSLQELRDLLQLCITMLRKQPDADLWQHPKGIFYRKHGLDLQGKVVALFPGQGAQYVNMGSEVAINFPLLRRTYGYMDTLFRQDDMTPLSSVVFPRPVFSDEQRTAQTRALQRTNYAQPAIGVFSASLYKMLQVAGFRPDFVAGHSFGELTALWAAEVINDADYLKLIKARGQAMAPPPDATTFDAGSMLAVAGDLTNLRADIASHPDVIIANHNAPTQVVLAGPTDAITDVHQILQAKGYTSTMLPVSAAFHTRLVGHAQQPFAHVLSTVHFHRPTLPVYSNATGTTYPSDPAAIQQQLAQHMLQPVQFQREIETIYEQGGYLFVEVGPRNILTNLVKDILGNRPHLTIAINSSRQKDSHRQWCEAFAQLQVVGVPLQFADTYRREMPTRSKPKGPMIPLNGSNYVSEKTRATFEESLNDGHMICQPATSEVSLPMTQSHQEVIVPPLSVSQPLSPVAMAPTNGATPPVALAPESNHAHSNGHLSAELLTNLERSLSHFAEHQQQTLRTHEQYLGNQAEFSRTFFEFLQQQTTVLGQQPTAPAPEVLTSLERSAALLHQHQAETLRVHEQYLERQAEYARMFYQIIQQHTAAAPVARAESPAAPMADTPPASPMATPPLSQTNASAPSIISALPAAAPARDVPVAVVAPPPPSAPSFSFDALISSSPATVAHTPTPLSAAPVPVPEMPPSVASIAVVPIPVASPPPEDMFPVVGEVASETPAPARSHQPDQFSGALLQIVSEKTGYPVEMLEPDMDMEADLGIDSIKRVEILGAMQEQFPSLPRLKTEDLAEMRTLAQITNHLCQIGCPTPSPLPPPPIDVTYPAPPVSIPKPPTAAISAPVPAPVVATVSSDALSGALLQVVSEKTGYPVEMLEPDMDMEADLGIDSIKRVEILGAMQEQFPNLPRLKTEDLAEVRTLAEIGTYLAQISGSVGAPVSTPVPVAAPVAAAAPLPVAAPVATATVSAPDRSMIDTLGGALLQVVSEKTGYPVEMLEPEMDMEADLGIDSIKRVEILGAMQEQFPSLPRLKTEDLAEMRTLAQIGDYLVGTIAQNGHHVEAVPAAAAPVIEAPLPRSVAQLRSLPLPDALDIRLPDGHSCLITDDGTPLTAQLVQLLRARGWRVVVLSFPSSLIPTNGQMVNGIERVILPDMHEPTLTQMLQSISAHAGPVGAFIHLNPLPAGAMGNGTLVCERDQAIVRHIFLMSKHLKASLHSAAERGAAWFVTVARLDGQFGIGQQRDFSAIAGGLAGLTKTAKVEWPHVFCRFVDIDTQMSADTAAHSILAELHDPNRLVAEVGYSGSGRVTIVAE